MLLTPDDLQALTHRRQSAAQIREMRRMGLNPLVRSDGTPAITWAAVNALMMGKAQEPEWEPDFRLISGEPKMNLDRFKRKPKS